MMRFILPISFAVFLLSATLSLGQDTRMKVLSPDSQTIASLQNNQLVNKNGQVLYTIKGNIVFRGETEKKNQIELLVRTSNSLEGKEGKVYSRDMRNVMFTLRGGRIYFKKGDQQKDAGLIAQFSKAGDGNLILSNHKDQPLAYIQGEGMTIAHLMASFYHVYNQKQLERNVRKRIANLEKAKAKEKKSQGIIKPYWSRGGQEWVWDGEILKPRWGAHYEDRWEFDGRVLKPVYYSGPHDEWIWDGKKLEPRFQSDFNTYVWEGNKLKAYWVSDTEREYKIVGDMVKPLWGSRPEDEWIIQGQIPQPVIAIVVLGIANR